MCIRSAKTKRTDACAPRPFDGWPRLRLLDHVKGAAIQLDLRSGPPEVKAWRNQGVLEREHRLDKSCNPGACIKVADIGFHGPDRAIVSALRTGAECLLQRRDLD